MLSCGGHRDAGAGVRLCGLTFAKGKRDRQYGIEDQAPAVRLVLEVEVVGRDHTR